MTDHTDTPIHALLLVATECVHCEAMKIILNKLHDEGLLSQLDIVDVGKNPSLAQQYGIRTVPWLKLGIYQFAGVLTETELRHWIKQLVDKQGVKNYFEKQLLSNALDQVITIVQQQPELLSVIVQMSAQTDKDFKLQLGISAVIEEFENTVALNNVMQLLVELSEHEDARIRADAAHFLSLTHNAGAKQVLQKLTRDTDQQVKLVALDALQEFTS